MTSPPRKANLHVLAPMSAILLTAATLCGQPRPAEPKSPFEGRWILVRADVDQGLKTEKDYLQQKMRLVFSFEGTRFQWLEEHFKDGTATELVKTHLRDEGMFTFDGLKEPHTIDMKHEKATKETYLGIYTLEADELKICLGKARPKEFAAKKGIAGVIVLRRDKTKLR